MARCSFFYQSSDGSSSWRRVRDWTPSQFVDAIDGLCELRNEIRSFNLTRMSNVVDEETGEIISDPWQFFGIDSASASNGTEDIPKLTWNSVSAIKALKFFTMSIRSFKRREMTKVIGYIRETCPVKTLGDEALELWLRSLWCCRLEEAAEYQSILNNIPAEAFPRLRDYAYWIAEGSGRKQIDPEWIERIESEFSFPPKSRYVPKLQES